MADFAGFASDPYLRAELKTGLPVRHREDPTLQFRSRTVWKTTDPEWNEEWIIHHMPSSGFRMKVRIYDEDTNDSDDRLGNVHVAVPAFDEHWEGVYNKAYEIGKRSGSLRAYAVRGLAVGLGAAKRMSGRLWVSVHVLGKSPGTEGGRPYTVGKLYWSKHYSPVLGRIVGRKEPDDKTNGEKPKAVVDDPNAYKSPPRTDTDADTYGDLADHYEHFKAEEKDKSAQRYNFQATQLQLRGPVPPELYHRYVEFSPFVKSMYTATGLRGMILSKALHHQHQQVYNFDSSTVYGSFEEPSPAMTLKFLDLCHFASGGRIHTYVITLDGLMRFTETGKEFGIDLLSKHTMHSDRGVYIAYSGEFFIRKKRKKSTEKR